MRWDKEHTRLGLASMMLALLALLAYLLKLNPVIWGLLAGTAVTGVAGLLADLGLESTLATGMKWVRDNMPGLSISMIGSILATLVVALFAWAILTRGIVGNPFAPRLAIDPIDQARIVGPFCPIQMLGRAYWGVAEPKEIGFTIQNRGRSPATDVALFAQVRRSSGPGVTVKLAELHLWRVHPSRPVEVCLAVPKVLISFDEARHTWARVPLGAVDVDEMIRIGILYLVGINYDGLEEIRLAVTPYGPAKPYIRVLEGVSR